jgi:hypothetical protein
MGYGVKVNDPYKGVELVRAFSDPAANRHSLQIEVNRRLYMDERSRQKNANFAVLGGHLDRLVSVIAAFAAEQGSHACAAGHDHGHGHHHDHGHDHAHHDHEHPGHAHDHHDHHGHDHDHGHGHDARKDSDHGHKH